jgi:hypothetical protein
VTDELELFGIHVGISMTENYATAITDSIK